ncbi:MAG: type III secretion system export apparatus subunit SctS [Vibrio sp.]|uniref:type III secretion system export apparatus subunit SctS n=1 Tax=Vibrio TaxID=662 RepID=UPI00140DA08C|nr:type III secretion system export apparatus subunit SctS [Vibrio sp. VCS]QIL85670.1 type III secretion system export apparatus subunit SctS [Vibrio sp. HDW18]
MNELTYFSNKSIYLVLLISLYPILVATIVGLFVALIQTVTQIQEQTLPFGVKLIATSLCLLLMSNWMASKIIIFYNEILMMILGV